MTWRTHTLGGVAALWLLAPALTDPGVLAFAASCAALGSLLADLDAPGSKVNRLSLAGVPVFAPAGAFASLGRHRGFLHSLAGALLACGTTAVPAAYYFGWPCAAAIALGYLSHLLLDCCTVSGLPLLWPSTRRFWVLPRPLRLVTGSAPETGVMLMLALINAALLLPYLI
jgi:inner membrane protein